MNYALITGGSRGIGRAIAVKLAQEGYHVLINYTSNDAEAQKTLELCGGQGTLMRFDVSDSEQTRAALTGWQAAHEGEYISVVVNNAGIRRDNVMALMPEADWHRVLDITLSGFYNVTQPLLPAMQAHKFGRIVNMASVSGLKGLPDRPTTLLPRVASLRLQRHWHRRWLVVTSPPMPSHRASSART